MKVKSQSEVAQSCPTLRDPMDCSLAGSSVHGFSRQEYWSGVPLPSPNKFNKDFKNGSHKWFSKDENQSTLVIKKKSLILISNKQILPQQNCFPRSSHPAMYSIQHGARGFKIISEQVCAVYAKSPQLCPTVSHEIPWAIDSQAPSSMGFSRQEYWSGLPCPPPGDLPQPGIEPASLRSPTLAGRFFTTSATWEAHKSV